jgi:16S rRNA (guanine527-N7)-methyltransferase
VDEAAADAARRLREKLAGAPLPVDGEAAALLAAYVAELLRWGQRINLTGMGPAGVVDRLILPSLGLASLPAYQGATAFADLGSGAGIPGLPLQIAAPRARCVLIEARQRRAAFLRHVVRTLGLPGVEVAEGRAEGLVWGEAQRVDLVVARAVAPVARLLPWCAPLLRPAGQVAVSLGPEAGTRAEALPAGWQVVADHPLPGGVTRLYGRCSTWNSPPRPPAGPP